MSRAILLPTVGDPFLISAWLSLYQKYFKSEVDKVYILVASDIDDAILNYSYDLCASYGCTVFKEKRSINHGDAIRYLLERCTEDYICLLEDDLFVLKSGALTNEFLKVEGGQCDIVGSTRSCASAQLINLIANKFNLHGQHSVEHALNQCPNLWPCLFFSKKEALLNTDRDFNNKVWLPGSRIDPLNFDVNEVFTSDTFVWASIQLRAAQHRFMYCHQQHASNVDVGHFGTTSGLFDPSTTWVHFGSLSSGFCGSNLLLCDVNGITTSPSRLQANSSSAYIEIDQNTANVEIARRIAIFKLLSIYHGIKDPSLNHYNDYYKISIDNAISKYNIHASVATFESVYKSMLSSMWEER